MMDQEDRVAEADLLAQRLLTRSIHGPMYIDFPMGWTQLLSDLDTALAEIDPGYQLDQVKEKFAGLRYYYRLSEGYDQNDGETDEQYDERMAARQALANRFDAVVRLAEALSYKTCTVCGESGRFAMRASGWNDTVCDSHMQEGWTRSNEEDAD